MNVTVDRVVYSSAEFPKQQHTKRYFYRLLDCVKEELEAAGGEDRDWLVDTETADSCRLSDIEISSGRVASGLVKLGFKPGDVLQTAYSSNLDFYWPVFGAWMCGGVASLADPNLSEEVIRQQLVDTKTKVLVCSLDYAEKYAKIVEEMKADAPAVFILDATEHDSLPSKFERFETLLNDDGSKTPSHGFLPEYDPEEGAIILWSSGTTGTPKGIVHCHRGLHNTVVPETPKSCMLTTIQFHASGFLESILFGIVERAVCYLIKERCMSADYCLNMIEKYKPEYLWCGVDHFSQLAESTTNTASLGIHGLRWITTCGGVVPPDMAVNVLGKLGDGITLIQPYGTTETGVVAIYKGIQGEKGVLGSLVAGAKIYIKDEQTGKKLTHDEKGTIMAKTQTMMVKILNQEEATKAFFDDEGFGDTGDNGYFDVEANLYFCQRNTELLKVGSYLFGPGEVEAVLEAAPEIEEAAVWPRYDANRGCDTVNVGVVFKEKSEPWSKEKLREYVKGRLPESRCITGEIHYLGELPRSEAGKKIRGKLMESVDQFKLEE